MSIDVGYSGTSTEFPEAPLAAALPAVGMPPELAKLVTAFVRGYVAGRSTGPLTIRIGAPQPAYAELGRYAITVYRGIVILCGCDEILIGTAEFATH